MLSEREFYNNHWYYFLRISGKWNVYMWNNTHRKLDRLKENVSNLVDAKNYARNHSKETQLCNGK